MAELPSGTVTFLFTDLEDSRAPTTFMTADLALVLVARLRAESGDMLGAIDQIERAIRDCHERGEQPTSATALERLTHVLMVANRLGAAAVVRGALRGERRTIRMVSRAETADGHRVRERLRDLLGPEQYEAAAARGAQMSDDEIAAFVLHELAELRRELADA